MSPPSVTCGGALDVKEVALGEVAVLDGEVELRDDWLEDSSTVSVYTGTIVPVYSVVCVGPPVAAHASWIHRASPPGPYVHASKKLIAPMSAVRAWNLAYPPDEIIYVSISHAS